MSGVNEGIWHRLGSLRQLLRGHRRSLTALVGLALAGTLAEACLPIGLGRVVDGVQRGRFDIVLVASGLLALVVVARVASSVAAHAVGRKAEIELAVGRKRGVGEHLVTNRSVIGDRLSLGDAVETAETDTDTIAGVVGVARSLIVSVVTFVAIGAYLVANSWVIGGSIIVGAVSIAFLLPGLVDLLEQPLEAHRARAGAVAGLAADAASGLRDIRGIGAEDVFLQRFQDASANMRLAGLRVARRRALIAGVQVAIPSAFVLLILGIALWQWRSGDQTPGDLVAYYGLGVFLVGPVGSFIGAWNEVPAIAVAAGREQELLDAGCPPRKGRDGTPAGDIVDEVSGVVARSAEFLLVTGADLSTLRAIAARLAGESNAASASVGSTRWSEWDEQATRRHVVMLDADARLVSGTAREILGARDDDHARAALEAAAADDFIGGDLDQEVSEGGRDLSGGQVRRLLVAQALAADTEVLILVEPTRSLDLVTERRLIKRLVSYRAGRTTIVCSQASAAWTIADRIVVVDTAESTPTSALSAERAGAGAPQENLG